MKEPAYGIMGGLIQGHLPFVCGGHGYAGYTKQCHILGQDEVSTQMIVRRAWAAFAVVNNDTQLFVVGGINIAILRSSEFLTPGQPSVLGPPYLGGNLYNIQMTTINSTTLLASGGRGATFTTSNVNYYFDIPSKTWTSAPTLIQARNEHNVGHMVSNKHGRRTVIVVAGGESGRDSNGVIYASKAEILDPDTNQFEQGFENGIITRQHKTFNNIREFQDLIFQSLFQRRPL